MADRIKVVLKPTQGVQTREGKAYLYNPDWVPVIDDAVRVTAENVEITERNKAASVEAREQAESNALMTAGLVETARGYAETATAKAQEATESAESAVSAACTAEVSASNSAGSAVFANEKALSAGVSEQNASQSAEAASSAATVATEKALAALASAENAAAKALSAETSKTAAAESARLAGIHATNAADSKREALDAKEAAETAKTLAETSAENAENAKTSAAGSAETAAIQAGVATEKASMITGEWEKARKWAEGNDADVIPLGGEHSSKGSAGLAYAYANAGFMEPVEEFASEHGVIVQGEKGDSGEQGIAGDMNCIYEPGLIVTSGTIALQPNITRYYINPTANTTFELNTTALTDTQNYRFELIVKMPSSLVSLDFTALNPTWIAEPAFDTAGKTTLLAFGCYNGKIIGNEECVWD